MTRLQVLRERGHASGLTHMLAEVLALLLPLCLGNGAAPAG
jgi:hypothetical protein